MSVKISIIVPCYNMEKYIEETLLSILNQKYENLELIIVDALSSDNTLDIISKYKEHISLLISEKDNGQYNAINKGMSLATGDILAWLNADDIYFPWTFEHISNFFNKYPTQSWVSGSTSLMNEHGLINGFSANVISKPSKFVENGWFRSQLYGYLQQEGMFWRKELWEQVGGLNENYKLASDFELWTRFSKKAHLVSFGLPLACFRVRMSSRSNALKKEYEAEVKSICIGLKTPNLLVQLLGEFSMLTRLLVRKFTISKSLIYFYSPTNKKWILKKKRSSLTIHSFSKLIFLK